MSRGRWAKLRRPWLLAAILGFAGLFALVWHLGGRPSPRERTAGLVPVDTSLLVRASTLASALEWTEAARGQSADLDRVLTAVEAALGYDLLDVDTWLGLGLDLDAPMNVAVVPAPPLDAVLVLSVPIRSGHPALGSLSLLFARLPKEVRPRLEWVVEGKASQARLRAGGRLHATLIEITDRILVALPLGPGDRSAGLGGWLDRSRDLYGQRLIGAAGIKEALRDHEDAPLLILCRDGEKKTPPCVLTPEDPAAAVRRLLEAIVIPSSSRDLGQCGPCN